MRLSAHIFVSSVPSARATAARARTMAPSCSPLAERTFAFALLQSTWVARSSSGRSARRSRSIARLPCGSRRERRTRDRQPQHRPTLSPFWPDSMRVVRRAWIVLADFSMVSGWDHHGDHETTVYEGSSVPPTARSWSAAGAGRRICRRRPRRGSSMTRDVRRITSTERSAGARRRDDAGTGGRHRRNVTPDGHRRRPRRPRRAVLSRLPAGRLGPGRSGSAGTSGSSSRAGDRDPLDERLGPSRRSPRRRRGHVEASDDSPGHCHHYPSLEQVRVARRCRLRFGRRSREPWQDGEYAYRTTRCAGA